MAYLIAGIGPPKGFHPVSSTTIYLPSPHKHYELCSLYIYHTLPPPLFVDTHELAQRNDSYTFNHWGNRDLERPVHALPDEVSELLLNVRLPEFLVSLNGEGEDEGRTIRVEVPMHLRYGSPKPSSSSDPSQELYEQVQVDWPQGFLSCPLPCNVVPNPDLYLRTTHNSPWHIAHLKASRSPSLPKHILSTLPSQTNRILILIPPHSNFSSETSTDIFLPLGNTNDLAFVEPLTALTILACCFWLFRIALKNYTRLNTQTQRPKTS